MFGNFVLKKKLDIFVPYYDFDKSIVFSNFLIKPNILFESVKVSGKKFKKKIKQKIMKVKITF